jgi:hypothetical protein
MGATLISYFCLLLQEFHLPAIDGQSLLQELSEAIVQANAYMWIILFQNSYTFIVHPTLKYHSNACFMPYHTHGTNVDFFPLVY